MTIPADGACVRGGPDCSRAAAYVPLSLRLSQMHLSQFDFKNRDLTHLRWDHARVDAYFAPTDVSRPNTSIKYYVSVPLCRSVTLRRRTGRLGRSSATTKAAYCHPDATSPNRRTAQYSTAIAHTIETFTRTAERPGLWLIDTAAAASSEISGQTIPCIILW
jgi:hypothetical protein